MSLYMNNDRIGYQAVQHGDDPEKYIGLVWGEAPEYMFDHIFNHSGSGENLSDLVEGELTP